MSQKLFAFWEYHSGHDLTYLGAPISRFVDEGFAIIPSYGNMRVRPELIVPADRGEFLKEKLAEVDREFLRKYDELKSVYGKKRRTLLGLSK